MAFGAVLQPLLFDLPRDSYQEEESVTPTPAALGAVYTRPWAVELLLDLTGYTTDRNLADLTVVEPSCGDGAFLVALAERLAGSCQRQGRSVSECTNALSAFDISPTSVQRTREAVTKHLIELGVDSGQARNLAEGWVHCADYLCQAPSLPPTDLVVGNPPYVRLEDIPESKAALYRADYPTMRGRADLYVGFFEAALRSLKPEGVCAFLCADRWMRNQYGGELRRLITEGSFRVETILELHQAAAFEEEVSAYPAMTVLRRTKCQVPTTVARWQEEGEPTDLEAVRSALALGTSIPTLSVSRVESWFCGADPWPQCSPERLELLRYLEAHFPTLESPLTGTKVGIGVATGADRAYIVDDPSLVESECILPLAMAADLKDRCAIIGAPRRYLVNPWPALEGGGLTRFPRLQAYLRPHELALRSRYVGKKDPARWYKTIDRVDASLTSRFKLYLPDIKDRIAPVLDMGATYPHHNLYVITSEKWNLEVLGGLLLSDVAQLFVESYSVRMRGGYLRFQAQYLRRIRVPRMETLSRADQAALVQAFHARDVKRATAVTLRLFGLDIREVPA